MRTPVLHAHLDASACTEGKPKSKTLIPALMSISSTSSHPSCRRSEGAGYGDSLSLCGLRCKLSSICVMMEATASESRSVYRSGVYC